MSDVYISCCPKDEPSARRLVTALEKQGLSSEYSTGAAPVSGVNTIPLMPAALREAQFCVILISRHALKSERVRAELNWAGEHKLILLPVRLDQTPLRNSFEYYLGTKQWTVADRKMTATAKALAEQIQLIRAVGPSAVAHAVPEDDPDFLHRNDKQMVIRILLLVLVVLAFVVSSNILYAKLGRSDPGLYWKIDSILSLIPLAAIVILMGPMFGGYKTFLRTLFSKIWDALRGK